jgi:small subunit ribosomal protein S8
MMTDPIADLLTRIRNGVGSGKKNVKVPYSGLKKNVCRVLKEQGYIHGLFPRDGWDQSHPPCRAQIRTGWRLVLRHIRRVSKPGRRVLQAFGQDPERPGRSGGRRSEHFEGVISSLEAKKLKIGGEVLCEVW